MRLVRNSFWALRIVAISVASSRAAPGSEPRGKILIAKSIHETMDAARRPVPLNRLAALAGSDGMVDLIVSLAVTETPASGTRSLQQERRAIAAAQNAIVNRLRLPERDVHRFGSLPCMRVRLPTRDVARLFADPAVAAHENDILFVPHLKQSTAPMLRP